MYNIFKIEGNKKIASDLDLDSFVKFCQGHNMTLYRAEEIRSEVGGSVALVKNTKEDLDLYKKSLSLAQINDISCGVKSIEYSKDLGFYLKVLKSGEELEHHYSSVVAKDKDITSRREYSKGDIIQHTEFINLPIQCKIYFTDEYDGITCNKSFSYEMRIKFA